MIRRALSRSFEGWSLIMCVGMDIAMAISGPSDVQWLLSLQSYLGRVWTTFRLQIVAVKAFVRIRHGSGSRQEQESLFGVWTLMQGLEGSGGSEGSDTQGSNFWWDCLIFGGGYCLVEGFCSPSSPSRWD